MSSLLPDLHKDKSIQNIGLHKPDHLRSLNLPKGFECFHGMDSYIEFVYVKDETDGGMGRVYWFHDDTKEIILDSLFVVPERRKQGIGKTIQLVREEIGRGIGAEIAMLWVDSESWMRKWYERRGYEYHAPFRDDMSKVWMSKNL